MPSPVAEVLFSLKETFGRVGAGWYLFGAQAALVHGAARLTADVDVTVALGAVDTQTLLDSLASSGFELRTNDPNFIERTRVIPLLHVPTGISADVVIAGPGLEELFLQRAVFRDLEGVAVPVACAEDIVAMKVLSARPKDIEDVVAILTAYGGDLDQGLVKETLQMLEGALDRSDLLPEFDRALSRTLN